MKDVVELKTGSDSAHTADSSISPVTLTERAALEAKRVMEEKSVPAAAVLRVGVKGAGCAGFQYDLGFDENVFVFSVLPLVMLGVLAALGFGPGRGVHHASA